MGLTISMSRRTLVLLCLLVCTLAATAALKPGLAHAVPTPKTALINGDSVTNSDGIKDSHGNPISLEQFAAQHLGYTVTVVSGAAWDAMTQAQFAHYSLLINGDNFCGTVPDSTTSNSGTWAPVVMGKAGGNTQPGNRTIVSTDPELHYEFGDGNARPTNPADPTTAGAEHLVEAGIHFAGDGPAGTTGFYFDTTCSINAGTIPTLDRLTTTGPGHWTENPGPPCGGSVAQIATTPEFSIVKDSDIQGWGCSVHETWPKFPADWNAQAVATDTPTHPTCGTDPSTGTTKCGEAYVLLAGKGSVVTSPDLKLSPTSAVNVAGSDHTITATVTHSGSPESGDTVTFVIASGPNAGAHGTCTLSNGSADPSCKTGSDGKVLFTYHDAGGIGTDTIIASVTLSTGTTEHASATKTWDAAITASGTSVRTTEGAPFSGTVATFKDSDTSATPSEYSASINWGDSSTSTGTITGSGGNFTVTGTHTYAEEGSHTISVTITDVDAPSNTATATSPVTVADARLTAHGVTFLTKQGVSAKHTVARFTDARPGEPASDYRVTIKWGDGKSSKGKVVKSHSHYKVTGTHAYGKAKKFTVKVVIKDDGGRTATATSTAAVTAPATAHLRGVPTRCVANSVTLSVVGRRISSVTWSVEGRTINGKVVHKGTRYVVTFSASPGPHTVTAKVRFVHASHTAARKLHTIVSGCAAKPKFTG